MTMSDKMREQRNREVEDFEGERGVEVAHDNTALQVAALLNVTSEHGDPYFADQAHMAEGRGIGDTGLAKWVADELARRAKVEAEKIRAKATGKAGGYYIGD